MTIHGAALAGNAMNSGSDGANPAALTFNEFDGYLVLDDGRQPLEIPWHVLPRQAADVETHGAPFAAGGFPDRRW